MANENPKQPWESKLREAASHVEDDVRRVITYINDEVVPDVRKNGSAALKAAAAELHRLAERMDQSNQQPPTKPPVP
jgi:hypothetical protein